MTVNAAATDRPVKFNPVTHRGQRLQRGASAWAATVEQRHSVARMSRKSRLGRAVWSPPFSSSGLPTVIAWLGWYLGLTGPFRL
jgi:hypothetical protein